MAAQLEDDRRIWKDGEKTLHWDLTFDDFCAKFSLKKNSASGLPKIGRAFG